MKSLLVLLLVFAAALMGCGKKPPAQAASTPAAETQPSGATASPEPAQPNPMAAAPARQRAQAQPAPVEVPGESVAVVGTIHQFMTDQLRIFVQQKGRLPKDFSEFTNTRMDSVPRPPPGMKYAIDASSMTVKLVRQ